MTPAHTIRQRFNIGMTVCCLLLGSVLAQSEPGVRPNILIMVADDLGHGDLGVMGSRDIRTPHIDSLAREGVRFSHAYANAPVCSPTRAALLTGRYQQRAGVDRVIYADERERGLTLDALTLPEVLKLKGYRSAIIGKWHLGYPREFFPTRQGFDEFFGFVSGNVDYFQHTDRLENHDLWQNENEIWRDGQYLTQLIADEAIQFLNRNRETPFLLYLPFNAPHDPFQGPDDSASAGDQHVTRRINRTRTVYGKMVEALDHHIGRVLNHLSQLGLEEDTAVFFMSDNGGVPDVANNTPFRDNKGTLFEGGIRTSLLARWPGEFPAGQVSNVPVAGMDLFTTAVAIAAAGVPQEHRLDGVNLLPVLRGNGQLAPRALHFHYRAPGQPAQYAMLREGWKYLRDRQGDEYLFDLNRDPSEETDLTGRHPQRLTQMREQYLEWKDEVFRNAPVEPER